MTDELQRYLSDLPFKVKRKLAAAIKEEADGLAEAIKANAPRKSGALANSVKVRRKRNELDLEVTAGGDDTTKEVREGSSVAFDYARAVEFGVVGRPAQPFFFSTYDARKGDIQRNIQQAVKEALDE